METTFAKNQIRDLSGSIVLDFFPTKSADLRPNDIFDTCSDDAQEIEENALQFNGDLFEFKGTGYSELP